MRALLVMNPTAGSAAGLQGGALLQRAAQMLGHTLDINISEKAQDLTDFARAGVAAGYDRILAAGGDGTINRVLNVLANTDIPLGIIPAGTANVLARAFNIPLNPEAALHCALQGPVRRIDLGVANGHYFAMTAGLGFDAEVVAELIPRLKELIGPLAYLTTGLQVMARYKPSNFRIFVHNIEIEVSAWLVIVSNVSYYAYQVAVAPDAEMDDGLLDISIFAEQNALDRVTQIGAVLAGRTKHHPNLRYFRASSLRIEADPPVYLQLDGDAAGTSPVDITVAPCALVVAMPEPKG